MMAGGSGKSKQQKRNLSCINTTWMNLTKFWHKNEFKNIVWQKEPVEYTVNTWKQF
jgi:hypothetical protein